MENFTLNIAGSSVVFDGTTFAVTDSTGVETIYSILSTVGATVVDVTNGETIQVEETDAANSPSVEAPANSPSVEAPAEAPAPETVPEAPEVAA